MSDEKELQVFRVPNGWSLTKNQIYVNCISDEHGNRRMNIELPFDELRLSQVNDLVELIWRGRAWMADTQKSLTGLVAPPTVIEPPSVVGLVRAKRMYKERPKTFLEDLDAEIRRVVLGTRKTP